MTPHTPGSAAGAIPAPRTDGDSLLESVRRNLQPGDPVARLLALWPAPPVRPVEVFCLRAPG